MSKMIKCKSCNKEISESAKNCPNCGALNKQPIYKKWWIWVIALVVATGVIGGASSGEGEQEAKTDTNKTTASDKKNDEVKPEVKEFYEIGEEVKLGENILIVNSVKKSNGSQYDKPKGGHEFIIVDVTIKNGGKSEISYNPFDFSMQNSQGQITDQAFTLINTDNQLNSGELAAGGKVSGTIAFEQPTGDKGLILKYKYNIFSDKDVKIKVN